MNFFLGALFAALAHIITFTQLQGQFKWPWFKEHPFLVALIGGLPISYLFIKSVKHFVIFFDGQMWAPRLIGFAIGTIVFTVMAYLWFKEPLTIKTGITLLLALSIICIQIFWR